MKHTRCLTMATSLLTGPAVVEPPRTECTVWTGHELGVAWASHAEYTGITWWFERRDQDGNRLGPAVELGWGYDGAETCALGFDRGRYLATWTWWDPYGHRPELRTATIEGGVRIAEAGRYLGPYFELAPERVESTREGWRITYRVAADGELHHIDVDRDGRFR